MNVCVHVIVHTDCKCLCMPVIEMLCRGDGRGILGLFFTKKCPETPKIFTKFLQLACVLLCVLLLAKETNHLVLSNLKWLSKLTNHEGTCFTDHSRVSPNNLRHHLIPKWFGFLAKNYVWMCYRNRSCIFPKRRTKKMRYNTYRFFEIKRLFFLLFVLSVGGSHWYEPYTNGPCKFRNSSAV